MDDRNSINSFREKRRRKRIIFWTALPLALIIAAVAVYYNWNAIIAPFRDAALQVKDGGFPVSLPGSAGYTLDELGGNFMLLTDTYLYTYNSDGARIADIQHGFQNPASVCNNKRILIYDKNGKDFRFYSKSSEIYTKSLDDSIVFAAIGTNERCAVITTSSRYSNFLYVFNGEGKQIFRWASPDYKIMEVVFSGDENSIYVSAAGADNGELCLYIFRFDLNYDESYIWKSYIGSDLTYSLECCSDGIYAVTSRGNVLLDSESGEIIAQGSFTKSIEYIPESSGIRCLVFKDNASNGDVLTVFDSKLMPSASLSINSAEEIRAYGGKIYVLYGRELTEYDGTLKTRNIYNLDDTYSDFIILGNSAYVLGYDAVQKVILL